MKKLMLLLIPMAFSLISRGQQITLSEKVSMTAPPHLKKLSVAEVSSLAANKFKSTKYLGHTVAVNSDKIYQIDSMVVFLKVNSGKGTLDHLKKLKIAFDDPGMHDTGLSTKIETIGNCSVLVMDEISEGLKMYEFYGFNNLGNGGFNGFVQYDAGNEANARAAMENLIKGLKFKIQ